MVMQRFWGLEAAHHNGDLSFWSRVSPNLSCPVTRLSEVAPKYPLFEERSGTGNFVDERVVGRTDGERGDGTGANSVRPASVIRT
jgi:hypothetical protein